MKIKREIWIFLIVFILSLITCMAFLQPHYTHDTYLIKYMGYTEYAFKYFIPEGRPITGLLVMIADLLNIRIEILGVVSFVVAIAFLSLSVVILYKIIMKSKRTILNQAITVLISSLIIFNYLSIEHIYFLESSIMSLGILLSVYACKIIVEGEKYKFIKAYLILLVAVFCYQGSIAIFPMIVLSYYFLTEKYNTKNYAKFIIQIMIIYGSLMLINMAFSKILFNNGRMQIGETAISLSNIFGAINGLVVNSLNIILPYLHIGILVLILCILALAKYNIRDKLLTITKYLVLVLAAIIICIMPAIVGSKLDLQPRTCIAFGATIGIGFWFILNLIEEECYKKLVKWIIFTLICIITLLNMALYFIITNQHIKINRLDDKILSVVAEKVTEYEETTGNEITKLAIVYDVNRKEFEDWVIKTEAYNKKVTTSWATRYAIGLYTNKHLTIILPQEDVTALFQGKDWNEFSEEQIYITEDTLYFCEY